MTGRHGAPPLGSAAREATATAWHGKHREPEVSGIALMNIAGMDTPDLERCIAILSITGSPEPLRAATVAAMQAELDSRQPARSQPDPDPDRCGSCGRPWQAGQASCCGQDRTDDV